MKKLTFWMALLCCAGAAWAQHDHGDHAGHDHGDHDGHDHGDHDGHDHGPVEGVRLTQEMFDRIGIEVREAGGGRIEKTSVFPAEIKLNRDTTVSVSPRYPSVVREVFVEIGDEVERGAPLVVLENRETFAAYTVEAPRSGVIITKDLAIGEVVGDERVMFEIADLSSVWADISVFPRFQHAMRKGMAVEFVAHDGHVARGDIKYISPIVNHETRTFTARSVLNEPDEDFTPGAFVRARVVVERAEGAVVVPREAVRRLDGETVVFVPSPNGFVPAEVRVGLADEERVEVLSGLEPGAKYVAVGAYALKSHMITSGMDPHAGHGH